LHVKALVFCPQKLERNGLLSDIYGWRATFKIQCLPQESIKERKAKDMYFLLFLIYICPFYGERTFSAVYGGQLLDCLFTSFP
jgi:hypothetical protein